MKYAIEYLAMQIGWQTHEFLKKNCAMKSEKLLHSLSSNDWCRV
jgi:hypothetical protein